MKKKNLGKKDKDFVSDYFFNLQQLNELVSKGIRDKAMATRDPNLITDHQTDPFKQLEHIYDEIEVKAIKRNELVIEPEPFDGIKPSPRRWIDDYERAGEANGWKKNQMVKYLPIYLQKTAYDCYVTRAVKKLGRQPSWAELKNLFITHYLGSQDKQQLRRQLEKTFQGDRESITVFLPRVLRLVELVYPLKSKDEQVEFIRERLRASYQEKLAIQSISNLDELNELCLRLEGKLASERSATFREKKEKEMQEKHKSNSNTSNNNKRKSNDNKQNKQDSDHDQKGNNNINKSKPNPNDTCHKCNRKGHYADKCFSKTKADGTPLKPSNKPRNNSP